MRKKQTNQYLNYNTIESNSSLSAFTIEKAHLAFKLDKKEFVSELVLKETPKHFQCTLCINIDGKEFVVYKTSKELVSAIVSAVSETKLILRRSRKNLASLRKNRQLKLESPIFTDSAKKSLFSNYNFSLN